MTESARPVPGRPGDVLFRPLTPADVPAAAELLQLTSVQEVREDVSRRLLDPAPGGQRWAEVAERDGQVVGVARWWQSQDFPGSARVLLAVAPAARGRGTGSALAGRSLDSLTRRAPDLVHTTSFRDDLPAGRALAERHGFVLATHNLGWRLVVAGREGELAEAARRACRAAGVRVRRSSLDQDREAVLAAGTESLQGLPLAVAPDRSRLLEMLPDDPVVLLAVEDTAEGERVVGMCFLAADEATGSWLTLYTGVVPTARGRGVAGALKAASLLAAARAGVPAVTASNEAGNAAMLRVNEAAGGVRDVGYWVFVRRPGPGGGAPEQPGGRVRR
jgi:GNAT superfamily N-acetyltransferase